MELTLTLRTILWILIGIGLTACDNQSEKPAQKDPGKPAAEPKPDPEKTLARARESHRTGNFIEALPLYQEVLTQTPADAGVLESLALCQAALGEKAAAVQSFRQALEINPSLYVACNELAWILATDSKLAVPRARNEALLRATQSVKLTGGNQPAALGTLAAAQANAGDFSSAIKTANVAIRVSQSQGQSVTDLTNQLTYYQAQQPWRVVSTEKTALELAAERDQLDQTVFAAEREAQEYETVFVNLWDRLLAGNHETAFEILGAFEFDTLAFTPPGQGTALAAGIDGIIKRVPEGSQIKLAPSDFKTRLQELRDAGWQIVETEWHHSEFVPASSSPASSKVSVVLHGLNESSATRVMIKARLKVDWHPKTQGLPKAKAVTIEDYQILQRMGKPVFESLLTIDPRKEAEQPARPIVLPLIVRDLNADGLPEIILGGCNLVFWNKGGRKFEKRPFLKHPMVISPCGLVGDFNGDGFDDFIAVGDRQSLFLWPGGENGTFENEPLSCFKQPIKRAQALTAGDVDGDGDLDLFIGQYLSPYQGGQMPSPWFDANDGLPAFLLINDGKGVFIDGTLEAGLGKKRHRRTYSASLVDLDADQDLDLVVVSDFAGLDTYLNKGDGTFTDVSESIVDERHSFGMSHTFDDFDADGQIDFYMTGMGSTTARRLQALGVEPPGKESLTKMRMPMGYGNRMYLRKGDRFVEPVFKDQVARTGWSWGSTSADFDNDGDPDLYVANGHISGKTTRDYCTRFWCHDIYTNKSLPDFGLDQLFLKELAPRDILEWLRAQCPITEPRP